jgi:hypothetical protein
MAQICTQVTTAFAQVEFMADFGAIVPSTPPVRCSWCHHVIEEGDARVRSLTNVWMWWLQTWHIVETIYHAECHERMISSYRAYMYGA